MYIDFQNSIYDKYLLLKLVPYFTREKFLFSKTPHYFNTFILMHTRIHAIQRS